MFPSGSSPVNQHIVAPLPLSSSCQGEMLAVPIRREAADNQDANLHPHLLCSSVTNGIISRSPRIGQVGEREARQPRARRRQP